MDSLVIYYKNILCNFLILSFRICVGIIGCSEYVVLNEYDVGKFFAVLEVTNCNYISILLLQ